DSAMPGHVSPYVGEQESRLRQGRVLAGGLRIEATHPIGPRRRRVPCRSCAEFPAIRRLERLPTTPPCRRTAKHRLSGAPGIGSVRPRSTPDPGPLPLDTLSARPLPPIFWTTKGDAAQRCAIFACRPWWGAGLPSGGSRSKPSPPRRIPRVGRCRDSSPTAAPRVGSFLSL